MLVPGSVLVVALGSVLVVALGSVLVVALGSVLVVALGSVPVVALGSVPVVAALCVLVVRPWHQLRAMSCWSRMISPLAKDNFSCCKAQRLCHHYHHGAR
jgi:hypothetical protein